MLSARGTDSVATPFSSVTSSGWTYMVSGKWRRMRTVRRGIALTTLPVRAPMPPMPTALPEPPPLLLASRRPRRKPLGGAMGGRGLRAGRPLKRTRGKDTRGGAAATSVGGSAMGSRPSSPSSSVASSPELRSVADRSVVSSSSSSSSTSVAVRIGAGRAFFICTGM